MLEEHSPASGSIGQDGGSSQQPGDGEAGIGGERMGEGARASVVTKTRRGTSNGNSAGSAEDRRRRRKWLLETYAADMAIVVPARFKVELIISVKRAEMYRQDGDTVHMCCRCYRCGKLLTLETLTVDRIIPGCEGGRYVRTNIRPACSDCNEETGGALAHRAR